MQLNFNAATVEPKASFDVIPSGDYTAMITSSEAKPTKSGTGTILNLRIDILEGEFKGRIIFAGLNVFNQNPTAQQIAQAELSAICHATGVMQLNDSSQLHNRPMKIKVGIQPAKDGYDAKNVIKGYSSLSSAPVQVSQTAATPTPQSDGKPTPPWAK